MKLILETMVEGISTRVDGSLKLTLSTQEVDSSTVGNMFQLRGKFVKCLLSDSNITEIEAELVDNSPMANVKKNKSESQRLRAVLFRLHEQLNDGSDFEQYYKSVMNSLIDHYKQKLD